MGQRGADDPPFDTPVLVPLTGSADQVVNGAHHSCALLTDGSVTCWGSNLNGQLGTEFHRTSTPRPVVPFGVGI